MSLLFVDGWDHYALSDLLKKWSSGSANVLGAGGRRSTNCLTMYGNTSLTKNLSAAQASLIAGFAFQFPSALGQPFFAFRDNGSTQVDFIVNNNGSISVRRGASTVLGTTALALVSMGSYFYFEAKVVFHASAGSVIIHLNGSEVLNISSVNTIATANATADQITLNTGLQTLMFDDLYVCNLLGSINNNFLGDCRVDSLFPTSDGNYAQFTCSTGSSHFTLVDETTPNTTDYNSDATVGHRDSYGYSDLPALTTQNIYGVQVCQASTKSDAGAKSTANFVRTGTTNSDSAAMVMTATSQLYYLSIFETDPTTAVAWTESGINGMEAGVKVAA